MIVRGAVSKIDFSTNAWRWLAEPDDFLVRRDTKNFPRRSTSFTPRGKNFKQGSKNIFNPDVSGLNYKLLEKLAYDKHYKNLTTFN